MSQTNISIRIDENLKQQFDNLCDELGLTMSALINVFIKKTVREQGVPFALSLNDYSQETQKVIEDVENGIGLVGPFNSSEELMTSLLSDTIEEMNV